MCSSGQPLCSGSRRSPTNEGYSSGSQYALCALGLGLVALGAVMIVWTIVPSDVVQSNNGTAPGLNNGKGEDGKTTSVAYVLVGVGIAMLLLAICLGVRNKKRRRQSEIAGVRSPNYVGREHEASHQWTVPNRQSNLRQSYQLPSYEDLIAAVENDGQEPSGGNDQEAPAPEPQPAVPSSQPARSGSRASRILRPLRVRRIKSEKLHMKDVRLNIQSPAQGGVVTIEPLTPPPKYEDKPPQLPTEPV
ncbi:Transmembrane protein 51 [Triplophysa tibetana]|uniref:Transmembrane protein 51 n=1 Tax=Triplophysa tibetana TaxID=1572043 RepID=A0A5A9NDH3_9TELE|nr:Transmembrane protein 51 [Triplophysa tibetana]